MERLLVSVVAALLAAAAAVAAGVTTRFDPASPEIGPFPADALTVEDPAQKTGRRINLPFPDCGTYVTACEEISTLNEYDGFSLTPRIRVRFSGPVNPDSLRDGVFLVALGNLTNEEYGTSLVGAVIPINQLIWDPETLSLYAKPDNVLDQHRRYALVITNAVRDTQGNALEPDPAFLKCLIQPSNSYCAELAWYLGPISALAERLGATRGVIAASLFTTMSATSWLERARDQLPLTPPAVQRTGSRNVFAVQEITSIVFQQQNRANPPGFQQLTLSRNFLAGVGRIAFGSYRSPNYLNDRQLERLQQVLPTIPTTPTGSAISPPGKIEEIFFQALLPASPKPAGGYPVVIAGHGLGQHRFAIPFGGTGQSMAAEGYAVISINAVGHGFGPEGRVVISDRNGTVTDLPAVGRGIDVNRDGMIGNSEGCAFRSSDCARQTALDLMQLVRSIRAGMDLDGDGSIDFDPDQIHYIGLSLSAVYGTLLNAVEPGVSAAVLNVGGGSQLDIHRWSPDLQLRAEVAEVFRLRTPAIAPNQDDQFEDDYVLRDQPCKIIRLAGAVELQNIYEVRDWIGKPGDPLAYAPHLRVSTLPGVPIKRVLFQFAKGDQSVPNPTTSAWIRAAYMREWAVLYRHDIARAAVPELAANPHAFLILNAGPGAGIAMAARRQAALFFRTGERCSLDQPCIPEVGDLIPAVFPRNLFGIPEVLPEDLGFLTP